MVSLYGQTKNIHNKDWCVDQIARKLSDNYDEFVDNFQKETECYWDEGVAPK